MGAHNQSGLLCPESYFNKQGVI